MTSLAPYRIRYLRQRYFSEMPADTLHAKIASEVKVTKKTVENWLAGKPSKINPRYAAEPAATLFAAKHTKDSERAQAVRAGLTNFILNGAPSPFVALSGHEAEFGVQLTVEHLLPFIDEVRAKQLLSKPISPDDWGDVKELRAAEAFLRGGTPNDWAMVNAVAIERPEETDLLDAVLRSQLVVLTSAAGDGKSTMLRRLALRLKEGEHEVHFFAAPPIGEPFPTPPIFNVPTYVLVDSAQLASSYRELGEAVRRDSNVHVVLAARQYEWTRRKFEFPDLRPASLHLERIDEAQAYQIARRIISYVANPAHPTVEALAGKMLSSIRSQKYPHLLAAMMSSTRGKDFTGIIEDMIRDFEKGGDGAVLRYVAFGALTYDLSNGEVQLLPHYVLQRLIADVIGVSDESREGRERVRAKLSLYNSELIPIQSNANSNLTVYDVRHPDIAHQIVEWYYGGQWAVEVKRPDDLVLDFDDICRVDMASARRNSFHLERRYAPQSALAWLRSGSEHEWLTAGIAPRLLRAVCANFENYEGGRIGKSAILRVWAAFEASRPHSPAREQLIDNLYSEALDVAPNAASIWVQWADFKEKREPQSARDIFKRAWSAGNRESHLLYNWAVFEWRRGNIGEREKPAEFSARYLFQEGWSKSKDNLSYALTWSRLEHEQELASKSTAAHFFSARGIIEQAWKSGLHHLLLVDQWARVEIANGNIGDPKHPKFPSGRWLLRNGTNWSNEGDRPQEDEQFDEKSLMNADHVKFWVQAEMDANYIGAWPTSEQDVTNPERFTARWILREAWRQPWKSGLHHLLLVDQWARVEIANGNIGDPKHPKFPSGRWLLRNGTNWSNEGDRPREDEQFDEKSLMNADHVNFWVQAEMDANYIGAWPTNEQDVTNPERFTARWILREAWRQPIPGPDFVGVWCKLEASDGHIGEIANPDKYSVRWLFRESYRRFSSLPLLAYASWLSLEMRSKHIRGDASSFPANWILQKMRELGVSHQQKLYWEARMAQEEGNLGNFENPDDGTARRLYRTLVGEYGAISPWFAKMELDAPDHDSNLGKQWSAEWLFDQRKALGSRGDSLEEWLSRRFAEQPD